MNRTVVPQVKVRYNYSTPSMSRRGGTRLHPIKDGTAPMGEQLMTLRHRDKSGQKLRDVVHPVTGFCIAVQSPLESPVSGKGTSGSHTAQTRRAAVRKVDTPGLDCGSVYVDEETGFVFRTTDMGDAPRPVAYVSPPAQPAKERPVGNSTGKRTPSVTVRTTPGGTGKGGRITDADCEAYIRAASKGREVKIDKWMIATAREVLTAKRKAARKVLGGK